MTNQKVEFLQKSPKRYVASIELGDTTKTNAAISQLTVLLTQEAVPARSLLSSASQQIIRASQQNTFVGVANRIAKTSQTESWHVEVFDAINVESADDRNLVAFANHTYHINPNPKTQSTQLESSYRTNPAIQIGETKRKSSKTADKRRLQIFEGACEVIANKGYGSATIRDIAKAANISIPSMYQYIKNKEDILYLITSMCMEEILTYFRENVDQHQAPVEALENAINAYFDYINVNRRYINLVYSETRALSPENRKKIFDMEREFMSLWEKILINGKEKGIFKIENTDLYANYIYFFCTIWALRHWSIGDYEEPNVRNTVTSMILNGIM